MRGSVNGERKTIPTFFADLEGSTVLIEGPDPIPYLDDVLQRIDTHPAREVHLLTPRRWKKHFTEKPSCFISPPAITPVSDHLL